MGRTGISLFSRKFAGETEDSIKLNQVSTSKKQPIGVIGAGSFGTAISNLLAMSQDVLLFSRNPELVKTINTEHRNQGVDLNHRIIATSNLSEVATACNLIFPIVPSVNFREMMQNLGPLLKPYHILIHGTKGFDLSVDEQLPPDQVVITRKEIHTMSEVIRQESSVLRVGCLSGPNLAAEIMAGQPAATLIASRFTEVIKIGRRVLNSRHFHVFGSHELLGAELAGAFKNAIAVGSGILGGLGLGKNIQAMLINRGLIEMINFGQALGAGSKAFIGTAGMGDLVATATSQNSRNYTLGTLLASGHNLEEAKSQMKELAEGVRTIQTMKHLATQFKLHTPITDMLYAVVFQEFGVKQAIEYLMKYPYGVDVDFL